MADAKELMAKAAQVRIIANRLSDDRMSGEYHSTFKGQGVEFDEVRPYVPGDDVRAIDWNVTARAGTPFIKRFSEERELTVLFVVDVSGSQSYGSRTRSKAELSAELACVLALAAVKNQDKVGLILFSGGIVKYLPPRKGRTSVMRIVREVLAAGEEPEGGTDIAGALKFLAGVCKRRAVVFLVSDFRDDSSEWRRPLRAIARRHDFVAVPVGDPAESDLPSAGLVEIEDPETGETALVDPSSPAVRKAFAEAARVRAADLAGFFRRHGIDTVPVSTDAPYMADLLALFRRRAGKR